MEKRTISALNPFLCQTHRLDLGGCYFLGEHAEFMLASVAYQIRSQRYQFMVGHVLEKKVW